MKKEPFPKYDPRNDGNVFDWIINASENFRVIRQRERMKALNELTEKKINDNGRHN